MQSCVSLLRPPLGTLSQTTEGKKLRGGKTERAKAAASVKDLLSRKSIRNALTAGSVLEMVRGPEDVVNEPGSPLGWCEVAMVLVEATDHATREANASKSTSKSGKATLRPEFMKCLRDVLKFAMAQGPSGVLSPVVPAFLYFALDWLSDPIIRELMSDQIWQCVRDLLVDDANRAMLTPPFIRSWVDACVEQLTGRGPVKSHSSVVAKLAGEVLQTLARGVGNYDILTQSTKSISPSKMLGGDFGYGIICERCCLMLVIAERMSRREARDVQGVAFRTLSIALSDHALDVVGSNALKSIITASLKPISSCWSDRPYRSSAVSLARILLRLAPTHKRLLDTCRSKILADLRNDGSSAVVRAGLDVRDEFIDVAASCVSLRECLEFASAAEAGQGQVILWLRVAYSILSRRVPKEGTAFSVDCSDVLDQCTATAEAVGSVFRQHEKIHENFYSDIVKWSTMLVAVAALIGNKIHVNIKQMSPPATEAWQNLYLTLRDQLAKTKYSTRSRVGATPLNCQQLQPDEMLLSTVSLLCSLDIIEVRTLDISAISERQGDRSYPLSKVAVNGEISSALEVEYFRNLVARNGIGTFEGDHQVSEAVDSLLSLCETTEENIGPTSSRMLVLHVSCAVLGIARGQGSLSVKAEAIAGNIEADYIASTPYAMQAFDAFQLHFGNCASDQYIMSDGSRAVAKTRQQNLVWIPHQGIEVVHAFRTRGLGTSSVSSNLLATRPMSGRTICRHFDVDPKQTEELEKQIVLRLRELAENASVWGSASRSAQASYDRRRSERRGVASGSMDKSACTVGCKILLFIGNYLLDGLSRGLISAREVQFSGTGKPCQSLAILFVDVMTELAAASPDILVSLFDLVQEVTRLASKFCNFMTRTQASSSLAQGDEKLSQDLRTSLIDMSGALSRFFMKILATKGKETQKKIRHLSVGKAHEILTHQGLSAKRKRRLPQRQARRNVRRKAATTFSSDDSSASNEKMRAHDSQKGNHVRDHSDDDRSLSSESDSDDGFEDAFFERSGAASRRTGGGDSLNSPTPDFQRAGELLRTCINELPAVHDSVLESCIEGIKSLDAIERFLSPDGFERPALACPLLDPSFLDCRKALWNVLFCLNTSVATEIAGRDLVKIGKFWKDLEGTARAYVLYYYESLKFSSSIRKTFPVPLALEQMRVAFLEHSEVLLELYKKWSSAFLLSTEDSRPQAHENGMQLLFGGIVDISEHFRVSHAFRMPRLARISYVRFGLTAVELFTQTSCYLSSHETEEVDQHPSLQKGIKATRTAVGKLLADPEAVVRTVVAREFPRLLEASSRSLPRMEGFLQDSLPQNATCKESETYYGSRNRFASSRRVDECTVNTQLELTDDEHVAHVAIYNSFRSIGARAKSFTAFQALGEVAAAREDLFPFCLVQVFHRVIDGAGHLPSAYQVIVLLSASRGYESPHHLYKSYARIFLPKWFESANSISSLYTFPVALVVDKQHHGDTLIFDWMRSEQEELVPHLLVRDAPPRLEHTSKFAEALKIDLKTLLSSNVGAFSLVFPMHFISGWHDKARRIWRALDDILFGGSQALLLQQKSEVIRSFLRSTSCGQQQQSAERRSSEPNCIDPGFVRDTRELRPPLYDPLIIALAINKLFESERKSVIVPQNVLQGSLFSEVVDSQSGLPIADTFLGFLEECQRGKVSLLRVLLTVSRSILGPPYPPPSQTRVDGFFCVGMLWRMLGINLLVKSSSERVLFYRLVVKGFEKRETVSDAAWMLREVQQKVSGMHEECADVSVSISDLCSDPANSDYLLCMNTSRERQMYELLNAVSPVLVQIASAVSSMHAEDYHKTAVESLVGLLKVCHDNGLWTAILTNGPFPSTEVFKEATKHYEYSKNAVELKNISDDGEAVISSLTRFQGLYRSRRGAQAFAAMLSCLQELRMLLTDSAAREISWKMKREAWVKSDGQDGPTVPHIQRSISCLINLVYETCPKLRPSGRGSELTSTSGTRRDASEANSMLIQVIYEIGNVLGTLGLLHPKFTTFIRCETHHRSIPALHEHNGYESIESGIKKTFFLLLDMLHSSAPIEADTALTTLIELLRSEDGKAVYKKEKRFSLEVITPFRDAARKLAVSGLPARALVTVDPITGDEVDTACFPNYMDPGLWCMDRYATDDVVIHEQWMRRFCCVLAKACKSDGLKSLAAVCYVSYKFSCDILPYLLMNIINGLDGNNVSELSILLRQHILGNPISPVEILRIFVHALDVLSQIGLHAVFTKGLAKWVQKNEHKRVVLRTRYVLEVPYVEAANAALRGGSYFSVLRFAQMHIDQKVTESEYDVIAKNSGQRSERRHSSCPARDQSVDAAELGAREDVKDLVLEAMKQINESDGIRAFGHHESMPKAAANIAALDRDWAKCFSALDIVSRTHEEGSHDGHDYRSVDLHHEASVMKSLISFGSISLATDYWNGLQLRVSKTGIREQEIAANRGSSVVEQLNDLRYAIAWKLGQWESPALLPVQKSQASNGGLGFHGAVYRVLHAFRNERFKDAFEVCADGRLKELVTLVGDSSGVSAKNLFQASARLHVLNLLEEVQAEFNQNALQQPTLGATVSRPGSLPVTQDIWTQKVSATGTDRGLVAPSMLCRRATSGGIVDRILGRWFGVNASDRSSGAVSPSRDAFDEGIMAEDLPIAIMDCLGKKAVVTRAASTISFQVLSQGGSGAWARSASCLGSGTRGYAQDASEVDRIAWKLQEARLRWTGGSDAASKKKALATVKDIISRDLGGTAAGKNIARASSVTGSSQTLVWQNDNSNCDKYAFLRSEACRMAASWSLDMRTHEPMDLFETFLQSGLQAVVSSSRAKGLVGRAHFSMASFADAQIANIDAYRKTQKYDQMVAAVRHVEEKIEKLKAMKNERRQKPKAPSRRGSRSNRSELTSGGVTDDVVGKDLDFLIRSEQKKASQDRSRLEKLDETYQKWQVLACQHFAATLRNGTAHDLRAAFRMVGLWLDSGHMRDKISVALVSGDPSEFDFTKARSIDAPVSKLLPLAPQLSSRLSSVGSINSAVFQKTLSSTIQCMAEKFPAHCLWQLLALASSTRVSGTQERYSSLYRGDKDKKDAADSILDNLQSAHGDTVREMKQVADAYIALSETKDGQKNGGQFDMRNTALLKLGELTKVPVPTVPLPLHGRDSFRTLPSIAKFEQKASVCAGLSKPLKVVCYGSDGRRYPQMVKGRDDLRGDAVFEQLFTILNSLLEGDNEAAERNLLVRTYRIVPLSPFSGIMQFVSNTQQFKDLLVEKGKQGASEMTARSLHERYRPNDMKHEVIQAKAFEYKSRPQLPKRVQVLRHVWQRFQPVFRFFFLEQWPDPAEWFSHQMAYSRSVAVMSIVGFILGLGDRHLSNILVDVVTGEVVHIDFGIAFEQGKLLPTPELMPFRLTRDIVDGFGISGVEGVFRKCSEVTLSVMRRNKDVLLTVVEVLLHDPMFNWALTPEEVLRDQLAMKKSNSDLFESEEMSRSLEDSAADEVARKVTKDIYGSSEAQRALNRISEKLDGLEGTERLSVEAHVARLVDEAQAFHVIAAVYPGWAPWV